MRRLLLSISAALLFVGGPAGAEHAPRKPAPAGIVSASDPSAAAAGVEMLRRGGSATDAAIATMLALNVVEPQNSGLGGGGFFVRNDGKTGQFSAIDGRETAPAAAGPDWFYGADGKPMAPKDMYVGGKSAGVPGALAMMWLAHKRYGRLPWADLFGPAIRLARNGFVVSARLHNGLQLYSQHVTGWARQTYFPNGEPVAEGTILKAPALADELERVARQGPDIVYRGETPKKIAEALDTAEHNRSKMTVADIENYKAKDRPAVCETYRAYRICGEGPPSGAIVVEMILKQLERFNMAALGRNSPSRGTCSRSRNGSPMPIATPTLRIRISCRFRSRGCSIRPISPAARRSSTPSGRSWILHPASRPERRRECARRSRTIRVQPISPSRMRRATSSR